MQLDITQLAGIALGSIMLLAVAWVWLRKQVLGFGGLALSVIGMLLISLTLWQKLNIELSPDGLKVAVEQLQRRVDEAERDLAETQREVTQVEATNQTLRATVVELSAVTTRQSESYQRLQRELVRRNVIDNGLIQPDIAIRPELLRQLQQVDP